MKSEYQQIIDHWQVGRILNISQQLDCIEILTNQGSFIVTNLGSDIEVARQKLKGLKDVRLLKGHGGDEKLEYSLAHHNSKYYVLQSK